MRSSPLQLSANPELWFADGAVVALGGTFAQGANGAMADPDDPLLFNEKGLHRVDAQGNVLESYGGVSGKGDLRSDTPGLDFAKATRVGDQGPIPEGNYTVNPRQIESFSSLSSDQRWESCPRRDAALEAQGPETH
jgi:hypothetical protein